MVIFVAHLAACIIYELASGYPDIKRDSTWIALVYGDEWKDRRQGCNIYFLLLSSFLW